MKEITNGEFNEIVRHLPKYFNQYRYEELVEMVTDKPNGYLECRLDEKYIAEFKKSPRAFMIRMIKEERDNATEALRLLGEDVLYADTDSAFVKVSQKDYDRATGRDGSKD